jgi:hypothetical protein
VWQRRTSREADFERAAENVGRLKVECLHNRRNNRCLGRGRRRVAETPERLKEEAGRGRNTEGLQTSGGLNGPNAWRGAVPRPRDSLAALWVGKQAAPGNVSRCGSSMGRL